MNIGAEIPFRRSRFARKTGSLILDRQREEQKQERDPDSDPMLVWSNGRFRSN
ncbi:hypothetical protein ACLIMP_14530 [Novosphingobium aerophilum]|uniref:hypothetical protein n=1 Tax=Novosphingobium TaxID=165696 RepID=UPI000B2BD193|nr:hypothetical protein [Novosphingobium sp. ST904]TCM34481.1 hypothetical protein EDF59_11741 [Novosphingobium sp. ST904]